MVAAYWPDFRVCWLFCVVFPAAIHGTLKSYTMDGNCGDTVAIPSQGMRINLTANGTDYRSNMDCALTLQVPIANRIQIQFESLDIFSTPSFNNHIYCNDWLEVKDGPSRHNDTVSQMAKRVCGKGILNGDDRYTFSTIGRYVTMVFKSGNNRFNHKGFSAILTPYRRDVCAAEEFKCKYNGRCIAYSTICDRYTSNPCGDGSARPSDCYWNHWTKVSTTTDHVVSESGCAAKDFKCIYNGRCIDYSTICDRHILNPCGDGSARPSDCYWNHWTKVSTTTDHVVSESGCAAKEFKCIYNGRCIDYSTICDRHIWNPCGDGSSRPSDCYWYPWTKVSTTTDHVVQESGSRNKAMGVTALVSIGVGGGILLLIVGIAIAAYRQMRKRTCTGSGRRISRTTRRAFRTRRLHSGVTSASDLPDCTLATITSPGRPPSYSEVVCQDDSSSTNPYPDEPPPPYTELY